MHLVVLHHGFWGFPTQLKSIINHLKRADTGKKLVYLNINTSQGTRTFHGIDQCGERAFIEITNQLQRNASIKDISFIGFSMGGLILRYVIGRMYQQNLFKTLNPIQYVSFATPHLGTSKPSNSIYFYFKPLNNIVANALGSAGMQMQMKDKYFKQVPLLVIMSHPDYPFFKGLALFKHRICISNTQNDMVVKYTTASISPTNPYRRYGSRIIDQDYPSIVVSDQDLMHVKQPWSMTKVLDSVLIPIFSPIWVPCFLIIMYCFAANSKSTQSLKEPSTWLVDGPNQDNMLDPFQQEDEFVSKELYRLKVIEWLNLLEWRRIDVKMDDLDAHNELIQANGPKQKHRDILLFFAEKVFKIN